MEKERAVLLLFLSAYNARSVDPQNYYYENEVYDGIQTNDAPMKFLLTHAKEDGNPIDKIFCITSRTVHKNKVVEDKTQLDLYKDKVNAYCKNTLGYQEEDLPDVIPIFYDFAENKDENETQSPLEHADDRAMYIYHQLSSQLNSLGSRDIYVDYTGGFRDISFLMTTIIRYLQFNGITCRRIVYSQYNQPPQPNQIQDIRYIYDMFQLINGVSEFLTTGSSRQLTQAFHQNHVQSQAQSQETEAVLASIKEFADVISLCEVSKVEEAAHHITSSLSQLEVAPAKIGETDLYTEMLKTLIPVIKEKLYIDQGNISYNQLIRWCAENWLLQQAVTLYVEKMPSYYLEKREFLRSIVPHFIDRAPLDQSTVNRGKTSEVIFFYTNIYDGLLEGSEACKLKKTLMRLLTGCRGREYRTTERHFNLFQDRLPGEIEDAKRNNRQEQEQALCSLKEFMKSWTGTGPLQIYGRPTGRKTEFLETLCSSGWKGELFRHYFLYNNQTQYDNLPYNERTAVREGNTYRRKIYAIQNIDRINMENKETLKKILEYYLAMKLVRNRMNHASETDQTNDEKEAIESLKEMAGIEINSNVENIQRLLLEGIVLWNVTEI